MSTTLANDVRNQCSVIRDNSEDSRCKDFKLAVVFIPSPGAEGRLVSHRYRAPAAGGQGRAGTGL